ncbi:matrixin family metalloprotease [Chitinophaga silvisoli]|nr:matrixin family metalloprotease [Chitinophaga silvisoli]
MNWQFEDYSKKPLLANQIFSKGFTVFVVIEGKPKHIAQLRDSVNALIANSFRVALTNWGVSMLINYKRMPKSVQEYLDNYTLKEAGHSTYNAPPVFLVECPENANMVVHVYTDGGKKFPDGNAVLAKAQVQGRTLFINMRDHRMIYNQRAFDLTFENYYNLVPILAHEIGHCFGLNHSRSSNSIMSTKISLLSKFPTAADGDSLAKVLLTRIVGTPAGYFNPTGCIGLRAD